MATCLWTERLRHTRTLRRWSPEHRYKYQHPSEQSRGTVTTDHWPQPWVSSSQTRPPTQPRALARPGSGPPRGTTSSRRSSSTASTGSTPRPAARSRSHSPCLYSYVSSPYTQFFTSLHWQPPRLVFLRGHAGPADNIPGDPHRRQLRRPGAAAHQQVRPRVLQHSTHRHVFILPSGWGNFWSSVAIFRCAVTWMCQWKKSLKMCLMKIMMSS